MRRALDTLLKSGLDAGHVHPYLMAAFRNYVALLAQLSLLESQIAERVAEIGQEAGYDEQNFGKIVELVSPERP